MSREKKLIVIGGPTASGKTSLAIALAKKLHSVILSADSRQFYDEMNIGTAKPSNEDLAAVPHHFIGHLSITEEYSVGAFEKAALIKLEELFKTLDQVVMVGGSGLYIKAVCEGLDEFPAVPGEIRDEVQRKFEADGLSALLKELAIGDPDYFQVVDQANPSRIIRAVSFIRAHQRPFSHFQKGTKKNRPFTPIYLLPSWPREILYQRIDTRVEEMMAAGLLEEAKGLLAKAELNALQTVGYQELFRYLKGEIALEAAVALIKQNSRRYAKRQMTWLRKEVQWRRIEKGDHQIAADFLALMDKGAIWEVEQNEQRHKYCLCDGPHSLELIWYGKEKRKLAIIKGEGSNHPRLLTQLKDQMFGLAEGKPFILGLSKITGTQLSPSEFKEIPKPDWVERMELPDGDGIIFFQPATKA